MSFGPKRRIGPLAPQARDPATREASAPVVHPLRPKTRTGPVAQDSHPTDAPEATDSAPPSPSPLPTRNGCCLKPQPKAHKPAVAPSGQSGKDADRGARPLPLRTDAERLNPPTRPQQPRVPLKASSTKWTLAKRLLSRTVRHTVASDKEPRPIRVAPYPSAESSRLWFGVVLLCLFFASAALADERHAAPDAQTPQIAQHSLNAR
jgi:hypothetical protein